MAGIARARRADDGALQLVQASGRSRIWLWLLAGALPVALGAAAGFLAGPRAGGGLLAHDWQSRLWAGIALPDRLVGPALVAGIALALCAVLDLLLRRHRLRLDPGGLDIATTFYRRHVALADLQLDAARVIRLEEHPELRPVLKSNGYALPGFRSGWFRLRNWRKAFVATSDGERVLWLPTTRGFDLLLQPRDPQRLLDRLRGLASPPAR